MASFSFSSQNNRDEEGANKVNSPSRKRKICKRSSKASPASSRQNNVVTGSREPEFEIDEKKDEYWRYIPLLQASLTGDWDTAKIFFQLDESMITAPITDYLETALIIAVGAGEKTIDFVKNLVELMPPEALALGDKSKCNALHSAASVGNTEAANVLVRKNPSLVYTLNKHYQSPIHLAALNARKKTLLCLLRVTHDDHIMSMPFKDYSSGVRLVKYAISSRLYDVAFNLVHDYPELAKSKDHKEECALGLMARKASAFPSGSRLKWWQQIIYHYVPLKMENFIKDSVRHDLENQVNNFQVNVQKKNWAANIYISVPHVKHIREQKQMHLQAIKLLKRLCKEIRSLNNSHAYESLAKDAIITATRFGIHEVIEEIVEAFPKLIWTKDDNNRILFQRAVIERHENVFNLIYQMSDHKQYVTMFRDHLGDTILHLAGRLAPQEKLNLIPGAALQMQRELQWFEEVKKHVRSDGIEWRNYLGETPAKVFSREHKKLIDEGQKWMKDTATSCTTTAALIVTMVFAAAITVPGGNNSDTGLPIFSKKNEIAFLIFAVSNAISLFTATTSLLMFLSILTSRYAEEDFLYVLPRRLIIGLFTLFLSITSMVVAFSATLYLVVGHTLGWILIPVTILAILPIISFVSVQFPLLLDLILSTYGRGIFGKQSDRLLY